MKRDPAIKATPSAPDSVRHLGALIPPGDQAQASEEVLRRIAAGDHQGVKDLAERNALTLRPAHLEAAIKTGHLEVVKLLIASGVSTANAILDCILAPSENAEILKFLMEAKAEVTSHALVLAFERNRFTSFFLLLKDYDSREVVFAAEMFGGLQATEQIKKFFQTTEILTLLGEEFRRDLLEFALRGAVRSGTGELMPHLIKFGARGDRLGLFYHRVSPKKWERTKRIFMEHGVRLQSEQRFPRARDSNDDANSVLPNVVIDVLKTHARSSSRSGAIPFEVGRTEQPEDTVHTLVSRNWISAPLLKKFGFGIVSEIVAACRVHDGDALMALIGGNSEILKPRFFLLEQLTYSGSLPLVKRLVENFHVDVNQHNGLPLAMAASAGYVDIVEYLISQGADVRACNDAALSEAAMRANAEIIRVLLDHGADPRSGRNEAVFHCSLQAPENHSRALRAAKFLIDAGASPQVHFPSGQPASHYLRLMDEATSNKSPLFLKTLEPRLSDSHINLSHPSHSSTPIFRFASSCAAIAARLYGSPEHPRLFVSLFKRGMSKVFDDKIGTMRNLAESAGANIDLLEDVHDVVQGALWDVIIPMLVSRHPAVPSDLEEVILSRIDSLEQVVGHELFSDRAIHEILKLNRVWHRADKQLPLPAKSLRRNTSWYPLMDALVLPNHFSVEPLTTNDALALEGTVMHHCVGGGSYATACLQGRSHILSVRKSGVPVATVELSRVSKRWGEFHFTSGVSLAVTQVRGPGNSELDPETERAFSEFKSMIHRGEFTLRDRPWGETEESRMNRNRLDISRLESMTGVRNGEHPELALIHYSESLRVPTTRKDSAGRSEMVGLLDPKKAERIVSACQVVLEGPPDKA